MSQKKNIFLSKLLFDLLAINIALGMTNLIIFYTFWVDGWSYPSLFIVINLAAIVSYILSHQNFLNPSFRFSSIVRITFRYILITYSFTSIYWLLALNKKYYVAHLILFFILGFLFLLIFRKIWVVAFTKILRSLYNRKNVMIISPMHATIKTILNQEKWLNYSVEYAANKIQVDDLPIYFSSYNLDVVFIDLNCIDEPVEEWRAKFKSMNIELFILNSKKSDKLRLQKIISDLHLYG